uniref:Secreted protein n=1 Tax=Trichogramma kaykai TaxID=54128 RepID=A0ABD2WN74_9HYME
MHVVQWEVLSLCTFMALNRLPFVNVREANPSGESSWPLAVVCVDCRCVRAHRRDSRDDSPTLAARWFTFSVSVALAEREAGEISPLAAKYAGARGTGAECLCSVIKPKRRRAVSFKETLEHERDIVIILESVLVYIVQYTATKEHHYIEAPITDSYV